VKTKRVSAVGKVKVAARAVLIKGAVHGVATAVANTPLKNDPRYVVESLNLPATF
jgi:hypothetical protein